MNEPRNKRRRGQEIAESRRQRLDNQVGSETDDILLRHGAFRAEHDDPKEFKTGHLHERVYEILLRMGKTEAEKFGRFIDMLTALEQEEIERIYKVVKIFGFVRWLYGGIKWLVLFFIGGVGVMATMGEQITKIFGYITSAWHLWKGQ